MKEVGKNNILSIILGSIAAIICVAALVLLFESTVLGTVYLKTSGNPEEVLCYFYDCIEKGEFASAYGCLADYSDLGLEAADTENELLNEALKNSYKCEISNDLDIDGLNAMANVKFTYLDLASLQEKMESNIKPVLENYIEELSREELYDDEGDYKQEFLQMVYDEVLEDILKKDKQIYKTTDYEVWMQYTDEGWKIFTNKEMIKCFLGGKTA